MDYLNMTPLERLQDVITRTEQLLKESKLLRPDRRVWIEHRLSSTKEMAALNPLPSTEVVELQLNYMWEIITLPLLAAKLLPNVPVRITQSVKN